MKKLGDILLDKSYVTEEQLQLAQTFQSINGTPLSNIMFDLGMISDAQLQHLLEKNRENITGDIGELAVSLRLISKDQLKQVIVKQNDLRHNELLGDMLVEMEFITQAQRDEAVVIQKAMRK